ncbi:hypothetical protein NCAS_0E01960 [Naumovozyma castellii]|uniref:HIG1 domain-containing protein n=1 Tax=Naumovozyma castellii TaxID=27288 RepID=G0VFK0_NAUCA|nr:hypothetical protein NCAS_0E01960 [Naumovozyma castellii CBS 4309]CCC70266.1 hypothetical protein NCAS_0E01960 [Naumovozyma castellii CBS 4309]
MAVGGLQPIKSSDPVVLKRLTKELLLASLIGGSQGALLSFASAFFLKRYSPLYRGLRSQVRVFYHCTIISSGIIFKAEGQISKFQQKISQEQDLKKDQFLEEAADNGVFVE